MHRRSLLRGLMYTLAGSLLPIPKIPFIPAEVLVPVEVKINLAFASQAAWQQMGQRLADEITTYMEREGFMRRMLAYMESKNSATMEISYASMLNPDGETQWHSDVYSYNVAAEPYQASVILT